MLLFGRIFLVSKFRLVFFPQISERMDDLLRFTLLHDSLRWTISFTTFCAVPCACGNFDGVIRAPI